MARPRILVVDCFPPEFRPVLARLSLPPIAETEISLLRSIVPDVECDVVAAADPAATLPARKALAGYHGVLWTGTPLSVMDDVPGMHRQLDLMRTVFAAGVPVFGICGGLQVGVAAAGGRVGRNPNGLESGIARRIRLTAAGRGHPMFHQRMSGFDALCDHFDAVESLPPGAEVLAGNDACAVQALAFRAGDCDFWGVQYHPDFSLSHLRALPDLRDQDWLQAGLVQDGSDIAFIRDAATRLEQNPLDRAAAWLLGVDGAILDTRARTAEVRAWLARVSPAGSVLAQ